MSALGDAIEMMIKPQCGPHSGSRVKVYFDAPRYNPNTDELDDAWVTISLPSGRVGAIQLESLFFPPPHIDSYK